MRKLIQLSIIVVDVVDVVVQCEVALRTNINDESYW